MANKTITTDIKQTGIAYQNSNPGWSPNPPVYFIDSDIDSGWTNNASESSGNTITVKSSNNKHWLSVFGQTSSDGNFQILPNKSTRNLIVGFTINGTLQRLTTTNISREVTYWLQPYACLHDKTNISEALLPVSNTTLQGSFSGTTQSSQSLNYSYSTTNIRNQLYRSLGIRGNLYGKNVASTTPIDIKLSNFRITGITYTPGCYVTIYTTTTVEHDTQTTSSCTDNEIYTLPLYDESWRLGYRFNGWKLNNTGDLIPGNSEIITDDIDLNYYSQWTKLYQIQFYSDNELFATENKLIEGDSFLAPRPYKYTHQLIGWTTDSTKTVYDSSWHGTAQSTGKFWSDSSYLPIVADNQIDTNDDPTVNGFPIKYYAVWRIRDTITFIENVPGLISDITGGNFDESTGILYLNQDHNTRHFNLYINSNQYYIKEIKVRSHNESKYDYINKGTFMIQNTSFQTNRSYEGDTYGENLIVDVTYDLNLELDVYLYLTETNNIATPNFSTDFVLNSNNNSYDNGTGIDNNNYYKYKYLKYYLNPNASIDFTFSCEDNPNFYVSYIVYPNTSNNIENWHPGEALPSTLNKINRLSIMTYDPEIGEIVNLDDDSCASGSCTFSTTLNHMSNSLTTHKKQQIYIVYEPFHFQALVTNVNHSPKHSIVTSTDSQFYTVHTISTASSDRYQFFNDSTINSTWYLSPHVWNVGSNNYTISSVKLNNIEKNFKLLTLLDQSSIDDYFSFKQSLSTINKYYCSQFNEFIILPSQSLIDTYHSTFNVEVTWSNTDYKSFVILQFPEKNNDDIDETDLNSISNKISFTGSNWDTPYDDILIHNPQTIEDKNRRIYIQEINNINSITSINAIIQDIADSGYILKNIKKYTPQLVNNSLTWQEISINRENFFDGTIIPSNLNITRTESDISNDILTLTNNNLVAGGVEYYFITYEEGAPIFYSDSQNNIGKMIQSYWESNRVLGIYYENTKIL